MKEVSVNRKGSSLRVGHGVERRDSAEASLSFWRRGGGGVVVERESSRVSAIWRTNGSEREAAAAREWFFVETLSLVGVGLFWNLGFGRFDG